VIVATEADELFLEGATAAVWECLDGPRRQSEVLEVVAGAYGLAGPDAQAALEALRERGLCTWS
jgi:hypothetical protein